MDMQAVRQQYVDHISTFDNLSVQSAINYLLANGYSLGSILSIIWTNLPDILAAIKSGDPLAILTLLLKLLGQATSPPVFTAKIGS